MLIYAVGFLIFHLVLFLLFFALPLDVFVLTEQSKAKQSQAE